MARAATFLLMALLPAASCCDRHKPAEREETLAELTTEGACSNEHTALWIRRTGVDEYFVDRSALPEDFEWRGGREDPFVPKAIDGKVVGIWLAGGGVACHLGFETGDVITEVNGKPLDRAETAVALLEELKTATLVEVTFLRGGARRVLRYRIQ